MPLEVVDLVLVESRLELLGLDRDLPPVKVVAPDADMHGPLDAEVELRYREAPLFVLPFSIRLFNDRVDERTGAAVVYFVNEKPARHTYLRRRQTEAVRLFHSHVHILGQARYSAVDLGDLFGPPLEHGVAKCPDPVGSHLATLYGEAVSVPGVPGRGGSAGYKEPGHYAHPRMADHYFAAAPSAPSRPITVELRLPDTQMSLVADRGVFSSGHIDPGTLVLLREPPPPPPAGDLLDLGCGYGPIACALARRSPAATVWAVDVNSRALELTRTNARSLGLSNVKARHPEDVPVDVVFTGIWSNPPVRVGKQALQVLLSTWLGRLAPRGTAWLVVHRHLGSDSLAVWLGGQGWDVRRFASKSGYRILELARCSDPRSSEPGRDDGATK
jgi:16S rRNA (guanine1207-N2)-methyltransferase